MPRTKAAAAATPKKKRDQAKRPEQAPKPRRLQARRTPNQVRSRETLQTVLRATAEIIERDGLDRLTTRRIAAAAGISIGALYEYFPNKQAVVYALVTDWMARVFGVLDRLHPKHGGSADILTYLGTQIDQIIQLYHDQPALGALITMVHSVPELHDAVRAHDKQISASVTSALQHFAPNADQRDVRSAARTIAIIAHEIACEAIARKAPDADRLIHNLKICIYALGTHLLLPR